MASTQRPKFRTTNGCCICRRKSSSSRFAPSSRWEKYFDACFKLNGEVRTGLICNACVLIVKRFKSYMPTGQDATWSYVVDCRLGPGTKNMSKIKKKMSTGQISMMPYLTSEHNGDEFGDFEGCSELAGGISYSTIQGKSRRTTILLCKVTKMDDGGDRARSARAVPWQELIKRRVKVPSHIPSFTHPDVEGYHTCCGIIYITPDCSKIWAQQDFFQHCQRLHPVPGKFGQCQKNGCPAFAARVAELHANISSAQNKLCLTDLTSCTDELESACSPASDAGVEVFSEGSIRSTAVDSLEFSEHDDFGTNPSSPASNVETICETVPGFFRSQPYDLTVAVDNRLRSSCQELLSSAVPGADDACLSCEV